LRGEETDGPHDYEDITVMLLEKEIVPEILSSVEGMPGWRSVQETMVWSQAIYLLPILDEAKEVASRIGANKIDVRDGRVELKKLLMHKNILTADIDILGIVVETNGLLERMHSQYSQCRQEWDKDTFDYFPTLELLPFGKQRFPRDWPTVWQQAGGKIYSGRMIARKDDPVWFAISDFGFPVPPFSFDNNLWIQSVNINEAEKLGVADLNRPITLLEIPKLKFVGLPEK
jgi:hypothetical protein